MTKLCCGEDLDAAGFVLAGGNSSRMGTDKATVRLAGKPLIAWGLDTLRAAGLIPRIAGARSDLGRYAPVIPDVDGGAGPLSGICAGLHSTPAPYAVFLSVDMPLLPASAVDYLLNHARITGLLVTVYSVNGFPQTFPAVIRRECLPIFEAELRAGRRGCFSAFQATVSSLQAKGVEGSMAILPVEVMIQAGLVDSAGGQLAFRWFHNVNSPADLDRAQRWSAPDPNGPPPCLA